MATLERAIEIAVLAHKGVTDKAGAAYILHPLRLMFAVPDDTAKIVAVLHDVVEDSKPPHRWGMEELAKEGFSREVLDALEKVTVRPGESYEAFIERSCGNPIARQVKMADLADNMNLLRLANDITDRDVERLRKYQRAYRRLLESSRQH